MTLDQVRHAGQLDTSYTQLIANVHNGFPSSRNNTSPNLREFWEVRHRLSSLNGIALLDKRIIIPRALRKQVLEHLHSAHQGVTSMKARAAHCIYWPGLDAAIRNFKNTCPNCMKHAPSQPAEPLVLTPSPEWPFQQICMDYFSIEKHEYLSVVDRYSGWICVYHFKPGGANSTELIKLCRDLFTTYGAPEELSSDGGPQFIATSFQTFLKYWGINHRISSTSYPQSNGRAELGVKSAKRIIRDNVSPDGSLHNEQAAKAILQYRNTPLPDLNLSPAQILFHRQLRDSIPCHPMHYHLHQDWLISAQQREAALAKRNQVITERYNSTAHKLPPLDAGTRVVLQNRRNKWDHKWEKTGQIVEVLPNRQYRVRMDGSGRITLQNRRFLRHCSIIKPPTIILSPSPSSGISATPIIKPPTIILSPPPSSGISATPTAPLIRVLPHPPTATISNEGTEHAVETHTQVAPPRTMPRALKNLQSHNKPGLLEQASI